MRKTLFLAVALGAIPAAAQADGPLTVAVEADVPVDAGVFREGLAADLDTTVELGAPSTARLRVAMREGEVELSYADGAVARTRRVALPADPGEATASLVLIASNLVRDPTRAMIAEPPVPAPPAATSTPPPRAEHAVAALSDPAPPRKETRPAIRSSVHARAEASRRGTLRRSRTRPTTPPRSRTAHRRPSPAPRGQRTTRSPPPSPISTRSTGRRTTRTGARSRPRTASTTAAARRCLRCTPGTDTSLASRAAASSPRRASTAR